MPPPLKALEQIHGQEVSGAQCAAHTLKIAIAIKGRAAEEGRTSKMAGLESTDLTGMPTALTDISGESIMLAISLHFVIILAFCNKWSTEGKLK